MTEAETYTWIFITISYVARDRAVKVTELIPVADAINHAIPTDKELACSLQWLESHSLVSKEAKKVILAEGGIGLMEECSKLGSGMTKLRGSLIAKFKEMGADNVTCLDCRTMKPM